MDRAFNKYEIATYLRDYANLIELATKSPNIPLLELYNNLLSKEGREASEENYHIMMNFMIFFTNVRIFSIIYDNYFQYVREEDLKNIDFSDLFINKEDYDAFKNNKKDIVKYIRNGLNHNLQNELCHYSFDGMGNYNVDISLKGTNPPFNAKIESTKLLEIIFEIMHRASRKDITILREKDKTQKWENDNQIAAFAKKLYFRRVYPKNKNIDLSDIAEYIKQNGSEAIKGNEQIIDKVDIVDYQLSWLDAYIVEEKYKELAKKLNNSGNKELVNPDLFRFAIYNTVPLGILKLDYLSYELNLLLKANHGNVSLSEASIKAISQNVDKNRFPSTPNSRLYYLHDGISNIFYAQMLYAGYMFDSIIKDDMIPINGKEYSKDRIRNSFVHMRNFFSQDKIYLFDLIGKKKDKIVNDLNQEVVLSVKKEDLDRLLDGYYDNLKKLYGDTASTK